MRRLLPHQSAVCENGGMRIQSCTVLNACMLLFLCLPFALFLFITCISPYPLCPSPQSILSTSPLSLSCVDTPSSHMYLLSCCLGAELLFVLQQIKGRILLWDHYALCSSYESHLLHRIHWCFIIKCKVIAKMANWLFCVCCSLFCHFHRKQSMVRSA